MFVFRCVPNGSIFSLPITYPSAVWIGCKIFVIDNNMSERIAMYFPQLACVTSESLCVNVCFMCKICHCPVYWLTNNLKYWKANLQSQTKRPLTQPHPLPSRESHPHLLQKSMSKAVIYPLPLAFYYSLLNVCNFITVNLWFNHAMHDASSLLVDQLHFPNLHRYRHWSR